MTELTRTINLDHLSASQLKTLLGEYNNHIKYIQERLEISINNRKHTFVLSGSLTAVDRADFIFSKLSEEAQNSKHITPEELHLIIQSSMSRDSNELLMENDMDAQPDNLSEKATKKSSKDSTKKANKKSHKAKKNKSNNSHTSKEGNAHKSDSVVRRPTEDNPYKHNDHANNQTYDYNPITLKTRKGNIIPRGHNQQTYVKRILSADVSFGVGPAGTGKTYLAVACAVDMLERNEIERILLVRPAVEAGEKLGFLPGDLNQKIDPYLRPLYDALYEMLGTEKVEKLLEKMVIEIAPLAYMRGRTLNNSFVILDEAQNTTPEQMKMFLTRLGFGSRAVITGDITQVDLPRGHKSGLSQAIHILTPIEEIHITHFDSKDVVRHHLVQKIVEAYDVFDIEEEKERLAKKRARDKEIRKMG